MEILKTVEALESASQDMIAYKLGGEFAGAVDSAISLLIGQGEKIADLENKVAELKTADGWIPVAERLPQENLPVGALCDVVQVLLQDNSVTVGFCNRGLKCWYYLPVRETRFVGHGFDLTPVVAWKPLSKPLREV